MGEAAADEASAGEAFYRPEEDFAVGAEQVWGWERREGSGCEWDGGVRV